MIGVLFFLMGVATITTEVITVLFQQERREDFFVCGFWYYLVLLIAGGIGFVIFLILFIKYKNRERGEILPLQYYRQVH